MSAGSPAKALVSTAEAGALIAGGSTTINTLHRHGKLLPVLKRHYRQGGWLWRRDDIVSVASAYVRRKPRHKGKLECYRCEKPGLTASDFTRTALRRGERVCKHCHHSRYVTKAYGADYQSMFTEQSGVCAICNGTCSTGRRLAVDHDHDTGAVRGLLCANCNRAIGLLQHDPSRISNAAKYLERNQHVCRRTC